MNGIMHLGCRDWEQMKCTIPPPTAPPRQPFNRTNEPFYTKIRGFLPAPPCGEDTKETILPFLLSSPSWPVHKFERGSGHVCSECLTGMLYFKYFFIVQVTQHTFLQCSWGKMDCFNNTAPYNPPLVLKTLKAADHS